jgi:hypothetical protein
MHPRVLLRVSRLVSCPYPSSVPLPASTCSPAPSPPPPSPPPCDLGPIKKPALPAAPRGLTAETGPRLAARSLVLNKLLKVFCNNSPCICPVGLGGPPAYHLSSITTSARSISGNEKADETSGPTCGRGVHGRHGTAGNAVLVASRVLIVFHEEGLFQSWIIETVGRLLWSPSLSVLRCKLSGNEKSVPWDLDPAKVPRAVSTHRCSLHRRQQTQTKHRAPTPRPMLHHCPSGWTCAFHTEDALKG